MIESDSLTFKRFFPNNPHPFLSEPFIELNKGKAEKILWLIGDSEKPAIGLIAGLRNGIVQSPFSAPFGGFHFRKDTIYISEIDSFLKSLKEYIIKNELRKIEITLPPDIYNLTFNSKTINSLIRNGFQLRIPDLTNWINLENFQGTFTQRNSREYYNQALRNRLSFKIVSDHRIKLEVYDLICENRAKFGRPIFMSFEDVINTGKLWPVDFFEVLDENQKIVASAIFYRYSMEVAFALFWGDNEAGRPLRAMDFIAFKLWSYYKELGFKYIDLGISTESGIPNEGLLRFKESHEATSSLRYSFFWEKDQQQK